MYKKDLQKIKHHIKKGLWWLDEAINANDNCNFEKMKTNLSFANLDFEKSTVQSYLLCKKIEDALPKNELFDTLTFSASGSIELLENNSETGWLHLRINSLLPNTRNNAGTKLISNTIINLLDSYVQCYGNLPVYKNTFLAIIENCSPEHCGSLGSSTSFDHDNKGFKAIPNALKGRIFEDDNQFEMSLGLFTRHNEDEIYCDIFILPIEDIADFSSIFLNN